MSEQLSTPSLRMTWSEAPWDQAVCGFPVLQITAMEVRGTNAAKDLQLFERERDRLGVGLVSCRLPHECMAESMLLEDHGFRFIEMLYQPELELSKLTCGCETHAAGALGHDARAELHLRALEPGHQARSSSTIRTRGWPVS